MSKRSVPPPRAPSAPRPPARDPTPDLLRHDPEDIALQVHRLAAVAALIAHGQDEPMSNALYLLEAALLDVEQRVERMRRVPG